MVSGSAARSLVTTPTEIFRLRMAIQMEVANLYIRSSELHGGFEILTAVLKKIQVFLDLKFRSVNSK
jgi:hypothetical protein